MDVDLSKSQILYNAVTRERELVLGLCIVCRHDRALNNDIEKRPHLSDLAFRKRLKCRCGASNHHSDNVYDHPIQISKLPNVRAYAKLRKRFGVDA